MITAFPTRNPYPFIGYLNELPRAKGGSFVSQFGPSALHMIKGIRRAEKKMPQCGIFSPRGARARASASGERKQAAARAENPFLCAASEQALYRLLRLFHCMIKAGARSHRCSSFPQKVPLGSPARLQARSQRLAIAANLLREQSGRPMHRMGLPLCI